MGTTPPTTENGAANTANKVIDVGASTIVNVAEAMIMAEMPFLATPIIKQLWQALFNWIAAYFVRAAQTGATFSIVDHQIEKEKTSLSEKLSALAKAEESGDPNAIKIAIQNYADAHSALVHYDGSSPIK